MEAHPVPQNVTSFEFHLIGDMTLKQFIYLAAGVGIAYLTFVILAVPAPIIAWPIIVISALFGVAFAFIPISDRPLDHWVAAFFKAIYSPTKRSWVKNKQDYKNYPLFQNRLNIYLSGSQISQTAAEVIPGEKPTASPPAQTPLQTQPAVGTPPNELPTPDALSKTVELGQKAQSLQVKILESGRELNQIKAMVNTAQNPKQYTDEFNSVFSNLQKLTTEAAQIKQQLAVVTNEPKLEKPKTHVQVVIPPTVQTQIQLTTFPNVINGIIKDAQGNYLDGTVVVIHDKDGLPVRALKTNKLGQFTGSTPLPNGTYTVELEKDSLLFDILQIELSGAVLPPLFISAKKAVNL